MKRAKTTRNKPIGIAVDGSCRPNPGKAEYRAVDIQSGKVIFNTKIGFSSNNIAEYCAIVQAIIYCEGIKKHITIWSDSRTAISWVQHKKTNSKVKSCKDATLLFRECEKFINEMKYVHHIKFWDKKYWGCDIPADYGRKRLIIHSL